MRPNRTVIFFAAVTLCMAGMILFGLNSNVDFGLNQNVGVAFPRGRVVEVITDTTTLDEETGIRRGQQELRVEILTGPLRGEIIEARNILFVDAPVYGRVGTRVVLFLDWEDGFYSAHVHAYERATAIYVLVLLFFGLLAAVAGKAGVRSAFGLVFTFVTILFLLIPLMALGWPPAILTVTLSLVIAAVSLIAIMGFEKKTYVSIAGTSIGIAMYCIFYLIISTSLRISGLNIPEMNTLITIPFMENARISEFLFCGILIASLGAVMDTTVSVASATAELSAGEKEFTKLFRSSMVMARDCIGASTNTLILAFTGTFFVSLVTFRLFNVDYHMLINRSDIAIEVLRALSASSALVLCAPATALIGSQVYSKKPGGRRKK